jgi:hypothetical protein
MTHPRRARNLERRPSVETAWTRPRPAQVVVTVGLAISAACVALLIVLLLG